MNNQKIVYPQDYNQRVIPPQNLRRELESIFDSGNTSVAVMVNTRTSLIVTSPHVLTFRLFDLHPDGKQFFAFLSNSQTSELIIGHSPIGGVYEACIAYDNFVAGTAGDTIWLVDKNPIV